MPFKTKYKIDSKFNYPNIRQAGHKLRSWFFVFIYIASSVIALPFVQNSIVLAADSPGNHSGVDGLDWRVKSYIYYNAISRCFDNAHNNTGTYSNMYSSRVIGPHPTKEYSMDDGYISYSDASTYHWFGSSVMNDAKVTVGDYLDGYFSNSVNGGEIDCGNASFITDAVETVWKLKWYGVLCNIGLRVDDSTSATVTGSSGDTCSNNIQSVSANFFDTGTADVPGKFREYIKQQVYSGNEPSLTNAEQYQLYFQTFNRACVPNISNLFDTPPTADPGDFKVPYVDVSDKKNLRIISDRGYIGDSSGHAHYWSSDKKLEYKSCQDLASLISTKDSDTFKYAQAYLNLYRKSNPEQQDNANTDNSRTTGTNSSSSCNITGVGWIVCPVVRFLSGIADWSFSLIKDSFLKTDTKILTGVNGSNPTYDAWKKMRDIANIAFVITFLIIIFSQVTSIGITNYGVKKLLPKIIIAAILVNLSYFICQIAVDISNILGYSIKDLLSGLIQPTGPAKDWSATTSSTVFVGLAGTALAATVAWASLGVLIPVVLAAIVSLIMILFILVARQALIILLIVLSPLAFVAFLLPNTAEWYKKWQKTFVAMLLVFPIVSLIFGASTFASVILQSVFVNTDDNIGQMMAAAVLTLPLFVVPSLLKKSLDGIAGIGEKINGIGNKASGWLGKRGSSLYDNSAIARGRKSREQYKQMYRDQKYAGKLGTSGTTRFLARGLMGNLPSRFQSGSTKFANERLDAFAQSADNQNFEKLVAAETDAMSGSSFDNILQTAKDKNVPEARRVAAIRSVMAKGNYNDRREVYATSSTASKRGLTSISEGFYKAGDQKVFGSPFGGTLMEGKVGGDDDLNRQLISQIEKGSLSANALKDEKLVDHIIDMSQGTMKDSSGKPYAISDAAKQNLFNLAHEAVNSPTIGPDLSGKLRDKLNNDIYR
ncbi:type IV secretion system protein [Candidatus Saccharibacteria bacterium]|nr:type IV secretion system protein [Candidatus Saccharibacteria bacterium]